MPPARPPRPSPMPTARPALNHAPDSADDVQRGHSRLRRAARRRARDPQFTRLGARPLRWGRWWVGGPRAWAAPSLRSGWVGGWVGGCGVIGSSLLPSLQPTSFYSRTSHSPPWRPCLVRRTLPSWSRRSASRWTGGRWRTQASRSRRSGSRAPLSSAASPTRVASSSLRRRVSMMMGRIDG